jgi:hypothetical protein
MSSDIDLFVDVHDLWTRIKVKYFKSKCIASTPYVAYGTNLSKGEEELWRPNEHSTSPTSSLSTNHKCLVANNDSEDESNKEEKYEDDSEDENKSTSSQGTFSHTILHASTYNNDRENETEGVEEKKLHQLYGHLNKEDKTILKKLLRRNDEQGETLS